MVRSPKAISGVAGLALGNAPYGDSDRTSTKRSLRQKMKRASMNTNYLLEVLAVTLPH
ncbi:MAG: hypothetical protein GPI99_07595 [Microcystis aeruginosa W13-15]|nr:hypothetical protein [Microcystis aeruginosa W13-16]NCQ75124.1 hypothetical protein [Microcystis aeruginosa W13-13]NCQ78024.1 hypothetical protein [Microcystis aeruginosa W13-15]NCS53591.1 hypothetical protein [Microcystis aeruginosa G13-05]